MSAILFVFAFVLVGTLGVIPAYESHMAYAEQSPRIIKQNVLEELQSLDLEKKKDQKKLDKAIVSLTKSLDEKRWMSDDVLSFKGKKVFDHDKSTIKKLSKIKSIDLSGAIFDLLESDRLLAQLEIDSIPIDTGIKKIDKHLAKAEKEMQKAKKDFDKNKFDKTIDHYKKAWKHVALKGMDVFETDIDVVDIDNDELIDYYVQSYYTGKTSKPFVAKYKIQDECVDLGPKDPIEIGGETFDDAAMKVGVSTIDRQWFTEGPVVWNNWFTNIENDDNQKIDLILYPPSPLSPYYGDDVGDDAIQGTFDDGSFTHVSSISELNDRAGWEGSLFFNAPPGDYVLWTIHPGLGYGDCDGLQGMGIFVSITE